MVAISLNICERPTYLCRLEAKQRTHCLKTLIRQCVGVLNVVVYRVTSEFHFTPLGCSQSPFGTKAGTVPSLNWRFASASHILRKWTRFCRLFPDICNTKPAMSTMRTLQSLSGLTLLNLGRSRLLLLMSRGLAMARRIMML